MKNIIFKLYSMLAISFFCLHAGKEGFLPQKVQGVSILPTSLMQLVPRIPRSLSRELNNWLAKPQTMEMLDRLATFSSLEQWQDDYRKGKEALADAGYSNLSSNGYAAHIAGTDYIFKIAGPKDRLISMLATKGTVLNSAQQEDDRLVQIAADRLSEPSPTYQTASRMAYYLLLRERSRKKRYRHVHLPESYLINIPGKIQNVEDGNVMFIQKVVPRAVNLVDYPDRASIVSLSALAELYDAVVATGLWNIGKSILVCDNEKVHIICNVDLVGLIEPKNSSAKDFFHRSKEKFDENVYLGLHSLLNLFKNDTKRIAYIKHRIKDDNRLRSSTLYRQLMRLVKE